MNEPYLNNQDNYQQFEQRIEEEMNGKKRKSPFDEDNSNIITPIKLLRLSASEEDVENLQPGDPTTRNMAILQAYKRIWENLDISKPNDAKMEPFLWKNIRRYNQLVQNSKYLHDKSF